MTRPSLPAGDQQARKVRELVAVQIGDQADAHTLGGEALDVEPVARIRAVMRPASRPDEGIDHVLPALVDEDRDGTAADVVEPGAGELEPLRRKIRDRRRERQPGAQPGLDRVLVRGRHVDEAVAEGGAGVARPPPPPPGPPRPRAARGRARGGAPPPGGGPGPPGTAARTDPRG